MTDSISKGKMLDDEQLESASGGKGASGLVYRAGEFEGSAGTLIQSGKTDAVVSNLIVTAGEPNTGRKKKYADSKKKYEL